MKSSYVKLVCVIIIIAIFTLSYFSFLLHDFWVRIDDSAKSNVMGSVIEGTLALSALSLTVLVYSISEMRRRSSTFEKKPYRRLTLIAYLIIVFSLIDAFVSITFLLTKVDLCFLVSFVILYCIIIVLIGSVSFWIIEEL